MEFGFETHTSLVISTTDNKQSNPIWKFFKILEGEI